MTPPAPDEPPPRAPVDSGETAVDSVQSLHAPLMAAMNDPVMLTVGADPMDDRPGADGQDSVQAMHGILMREHAEPRDGFEPVPVWVMAVFGALLMWGGYYIGSGSADFRRDVNDGSEITFAGLPTDPDNPPPDPDPKTVAELVQIGEARYRNVCIACHKADGEGDPTQQAPPLRGSEWVTGKEASPARLARVVLFGLHQPIEVGGKSFNGQMPAQGVALKDYEIAAALTYVRNSFGHKADTDDAKPTIPT
ncbi:MAG TPA: cytochrome c, partial [Urbifossiella sp.]|nr:cytochrome c [Urbifossiella sp.]